MAAAAAAAAAAAGGAALECCRVNYRLLWPTMVGRAHPQPAWGRLAVAAGLQRARPAGGCWHWQHRELISSLVQEQLVQTAQVPHSVFISSARTGGEAVIVGKNK